ncbi:hypothetical protein ACYF6T_23200 [Streptomyces sp. 7R007]
MGISLAMVRYMDTGACPRCGAQLLNSALALLNKSLSLSGSRSLTAWERTRLAPSSAPVTFTPPNTFRCGYCRQTWEVRTKPAVPPAVSQALLNSALAQKSSWNPSPPAATGPRTLLPGQFRFTGVVEGKPDEVFARTETRVVRNDSSGTLTDTEEFSWAVERTVTVEDRKATIKGTDGRLTFAGLAVLGGMLSSEVRSVYAVTTQATLSRRKTVSVQVPPHSAIEIQLHWKVVRQPGIGRFVAGGARLDMPFAVDIELTVVPYTRNV